MMRRNSGITLIETLMVAAITAIIVSGVSSSYIAAHNFQARLGPRQEQMAIVTSFEDRVTKLLEKAYLSAQADDTQTFFVASISGDNPIEPTTSNSASLPDTLIFSSIGESPNAAYSAATDPFETLNEQYGPQGGIGEYSLSTVAVGDPGDKTGLFFREQRPSDGDPFQGGYESVMSEHVSTIGFEFYDGTQWVSEWDTTTSGERRIPAAVRVSYTLDNDDGQTHAFVVRLIYSDVTPENPVATGGVGGGQ